MLLVQNRNAYKKCDKIQERRHISDQVYVKSMRDEYKMLPFVKN